MRDQVVTVATHRLSEAILAAACTVALVLGRFALPWFVPPLLALAGAALAIDLSRREHRAPGPVRPLACVIGVLFVAAVVSPANMPNDLRPYAADGRLVAHYHLNPYLVSPREIERDPVFDDIRDAPAPYGALFLGAATAASIVADALVVPERMLYQGAAALAMGAALLLLWRSRRSTAALALVGLHPVVAGTIVNGGHNDAFIGLALLAAVLAAERRRWLAAGLVIAVAMLVKVTAGLVLLPLAVWAFAHAGRRAAIGVIAPALLVAVPLTIAIPGSFHALRASDLGFVTRTSIWNLYPLRDPLFPRLGDGAVTQVALIVIGVAIVVVSFGRQPLGPRVTGAAAAWLVGSAYVMPWYTVWALPVAGLDPRARFSRVVAWQGAVVTAAFVVPRRLLTSWFISFPLGWIASIALVIAFVWAVRAPTAGEPVAADALPRALPAARSLRAS